MKRAFASFVLFSNLLSSAHAATEAGDRCLEAYRLEGFDRAFNGATLEVVGASMLGGSLVARAFASWSREELGLLTFPVLGSVPVALAGVFQRKVAKFDRVLVGAVAESRENILGNNTQNLAEGLNAHIFGQTVRGFGPLSISFGLSAIEHTRHQLDRELNYRAFSPQAVQQILQALDSQDQLCDGIGHPRTIGDLVNLMVSTAGRNAAQ